MIIRDYCKKCKYFSLGFDVFYVWEKDVLENPEKVEKELIEFILPSTD